MSLEMTKNHLIQLLDDQDNKVVALSGKWGTGKSHLWREIKKGSTDAKVQSALYVSLFGLASMDQVKLKIVQSSIPLAGENPVWWDRAKKSWSAASKVLESVNKGFGAINEIALLAVPSFLKDRFIVLDDIERKHEKLSVDEVMGFIDEFTQQYGSRILLILNSDQLADKPIWETLREKVIDQEVRLETTPTEAFNIAVGIAPTPYVDRVRNALEICGVTNIRIICKIIRALNRILCKRSDLSDDVLSRVVPSTVLLAATHYKGLENGPDFEFILKIANPDHWGDYGKQVEELDDAGKQRVKWGLKLDELGINGCDEYENIIVDFLKSGLFDAAEVTKIIDRYAREADTMRLHSLGKQFIKHTIWHYKMSDDELIAEATEIAKQSHLLDAYSVTSLFEAISELENGAPVADRLLKNWISEFQKSETNNFDFENSWNQPIHPDIQMAFDAAKAKDQETSTVFEACRHIVQSNGWGEKQKAILSSATVQDFEATIKTLEINDLQLFMRRFLEMCVQSTNYKQHFGLATDRFMDACRNIHNDKTEAKLGKLLMVLFKSSRLEAHLASSEAVAATALGARSTSVGQMKSMS